MMENKKKPEILAPAGSMEGLKAAIAAKCDAIYIGGSRFGARAFADNPKEDEMLEAIDYCHLHGVKIYMTVNTILKNREMEESLFAYLRPYYEAGLDAVIVQDVGVLRFIKEHFPKLFVHASTQMTLTMGRGKEFLEEYHVNRMVPARELTLAELQQMRKETPLELEVFVHGALCYCYSGQCLFSSMQGGRSGNRGRCAQPCRMAYLCDGETRGEEKYLLSPRELCNLSYIGDMIEAGIDSFKIEGRMKRPEYTAFVTSIYRKYVDLYCGLGKAKYNAYIQEHQKEWNQDLQDLADIYNREGFTQGYLEGKSGSVGDRHAGQKGQMLANLRPKHGGVCVGEVLLVNKHEVTYKATKEILRQDVVEFRNEKQYPSYEYTLGDDVRVNQHVTARYMKGSKIHVGDKVYRTKNAHLLERIRTSYLIENDQQGVYGECHASLGEAFTLTVSLGEHTVTRKGDLCQEAQKQAATKESVEKVLKQTGTSEFFFDKLSTSVEENLFIPVGAIKKLRREAFAALHECIVKEARRNDTILEGQVVQSSSGCKSTLRDDRYAEYIPTVCASVMELAQLEPVLKDERIAIVYLRTEIMSSSELKEAAHRIREANKKSWLVMPAVFRKDIWYLFEKEYLENGMLFGTDFDGYLIKNMESISFLREIIGVSNDKIRLDSNMYVMNEEAVIFWREQGIAKFCTPLEATESELENFRNMSSMEMIVYGKIPLMVTAQCVCSNQKGCVYANEKHHHQVISFEDQRQRRFESVNYCKYCYNIIYQEIPLYLPEQIDGWNTLYPENLRYDFTTESTAEIEAVLAGDIEIETQKGHFETGIE